ncbi:MAG: YegS/Rv2252/BmrU family lipid kinase [Saccharospirillaceae bacterium]|nr:YegS/Rv2252/BmrU family lipid kinase [Pseudomonadales bacterium]NRB81627.1 YegS/Rv2252/BmrU family lipid kinase [Saccharospirillaceae bacterium]
MSVSESTNYFILINPLNAKKGQKYLNEIVKLCLAYQFSYQIYYSTIDFQYDLQFIQSQKNIDRLIVIGGDGLINLSVNVIAKTTIELIVIPAGSGNDFSRTLYAGQKLNIKKLLTSPSKKLNLIQVNNRYCINVAGLGFDVYSLNKMSVTLKKYMGSFAYTICAIRSLFSYQSHKIEYFNETCWQSTRPLLMVFALGRYFGGGLQVNPGVVHDNQEGFTMILCEDKGFLFTVKALVFLLFSQHFRLSSISVKKTKSIKIKSNQAICLELDGELVSFSAKQLIKIKYIKHAIKVVHYE